MRRGFILPVVAGFCVLAGTSFAQPVRSPQHVTITVHEGTSMAVSVSPDGKMLAMDLQGSIYVLPVGGGEAGGSRISSMTRASRNGRRTARTSYFSAIAPAVTTFGKLGLTVLTSIS